jgi:DNA-binding transcriptional LysR family regulator
MDVGVRIGELPDSAMKAISVGHVRRVACASPAYLKAHGVPHVPADLAKHAVVAASPVSPSVDWRFNSGKQTISVKVKPRLTVTNNEAAIVAAVQGFGVTGLLSYQIAHISLQVSSRPFCAITSRRICPYMSCTVKADKRLQKCGHLLICWWNGCEKTRHYADLTLCLQVYRRGLRSRGVAASR